jgi:hypothetical protein
MTRTTSNGPLLLSVQLSDAFASAATNATFSLVHDMAGETLMEIV